MKVLATKGSYQETYICEVSHRELEKFMDQYYDKMKRLKEGDEINLGEGYDFYTKTKAALNKTQEFIKANAEVVSMITKGISIFGGESEK